MYAYQGRSEMLFLRKIMRTYLMNDLKTKTPDGKQMSDTTPAQMDGKSAHVFKKGTNNFADALK